LVKLVFTTQERKKTPNLEAEKKKNQEKKKERLE